MRKHGWIKLSRLLSESAEFWETRPTPPILALIDIFMLVNSQKNQIPFDDGMIEIREGERLISIEQLADRWAWSTTKVRTYLNKWNITRRTIGKARKKSTIINISANYYWKLCHQDPSEKNDENLPKKTTKHIENTELYSFLASLKKSLKLIEKNTNKNKNNNINNTIGADAPIEYPEMHEWKLKVGLVNAYLKKIDKLGAGDFSFCTKLLKDHGIVLVLAKLEQIIASEPVFNDAKHARQYLMASMKKAAIGNTRIGKPQIDDEPGLASVLYGRSDFRFPRMEDVQKEREGK